ncbi:MAG: multidrug effflux MFS transporter [Candidatus Promineifilaceae bacterium]
MSIKQSTEPSFAEFVILLSLMMSLTALSIDAMLPALPQLAADLQVQSANSRQLVISALFLGLAGGQLIFGPLSDSVGRKPSIYAGLGVFIAGSIISASAVNFPMMLTGRFMQGVGVSGPRAVGMALVRDRYSGRAMARVMSFVMTVFILVPMIAPIFGQAVLLFTGWRSIFVAFILLALVTLGWFALRMPETLDSRDRAPFSLQRIVSATREILHIRPAVGFTVTAGLIGGAHLGYLNSAQQIFQEQYQLGQLFPFVFSLVALSIGLASFLNARLVMRFGMHFLVRKSLYAMIGLSLLALIAAMVMGGTPPLWLLVIYLLLVFFSVGILFGNQNALAMEPLGHMAGIGAAIVGSFATFISVPAGTYIGQSYNGTVVPLIAGMAILGSVSLLIVNWIEST